MEDKFHNIRLELARPHVSNNSRDFREIYLIGEKGKVLLQVDKDYNDFWFPVGTYIIGCLENKVVQSSSNQDIFNPSSFVPSPIVGYYPLIIKSVVNRLDLVDVNPRSTSKINYFQDLDEDDIKMIARFKGDYKLEALA